MKVDKMANTPKVTIRLEQQYVEFLDRHTGQKDIDRSGQLRADLETLIQLRKLGRRVLAVFAPNQINLIREALSGFVYEPAHLLSLPAIISMSVQDSALDGLGERWEVDVGALTKKVHTLTPVEAWGVVEEVREMWRKND